MLRITTLVGEDRITLKLEGKLRGPWNCELVKVWSKARSAPERVNEFETGGGIV
jgi:hypothetical protein